MRPQNVSLELSSPQATADCAMALGERLLPGDVVLLSGDVGAGKTHFARSLINSILTEPEDIPSPTFTLVQLYDTRRGPLWHADLYRIGSVNEIEELGLLDAFDTTISVVEWPDRLGDMAPPDALTVELRPGASDDARHMTARWQGNRWADRLKGWPEQ